MLYIQVALSQKRALLLDDQPTRLSFLDAFSFPLLFFSGQR